MAKLVILYAVFFLVSCLELVSSDTFNHQSSSLADGCACSERYYVDTPPYHVIVCQFITSIERVTCAQDFLAGLSKDGSVLQLEYDYSHLDLFPDDIFVGLSITALTIYSCNIKDIPFRVINPGCANVTMLKFYENDIASIPASGFDCPNLHYLLLSNNNIENISLDAFQNLENLVVLDLQVNNLFSLPNFSGLKNLVELYVSENEINFVSKDAFVGYGNMNLVYLAHNNISHLQDGTFDPLTNPYAVVLLEANPFNCDCSLKWLQDWANEHNTDEPQCTAPVQGPMKNADFCPRSSWIFYWK